MIEASYHEAPGYGSTVFVLMIAYWAAGRVEDARRMAGELAVTETLAVSRCNHAPHLALVRDALIGTGFPD